MKRCVLNVLAGVSLVLSVAMVMLWVRSYSRSDVFSKIGPIGAEVLSSRGRLEIETYHGWPSSLPFQWDRTGLRRRNEGDATYRMLGAGSRNYFSWGPFGMSKGETLLVSRIGPASPTVTVTHIWIRIPHWFATLIFAMLPALVLTNTVRRHQRQQRILKNCCLICGYDLRATPDRCPECGTVTKVPN